MKVRFKRGWWRTYASLTPGNAYRVLGVESDQLRIVDDLGEPVLFSVLAFDVVDAAEPTDWISERDGNGERTAGPRELAVPYLWERWHDRDPEARVTLSRYLHRLAWREAAALEESANTYLRVAWKHAPLDEPIMLYSELDEDRFEVRKVELFADGHAGWAEGRDSTVETRLGIVPVPPLDAIAAHPEFEPVLISRADFERIWQQTALADLEE